VAVHGSWMGSTGTRGSTTTDYGSTTRSGGAWMGSTGGTANAAFGSTNGGASMGSSTSSLIGAALGSSVVILQSEEPTYFPSYVPSIAPSTYPTYAPTQDSQAPDITTLFPTVKKQYFRPKPKSNKKCSSNLEEKCCNDPPSNSALYSKYKACKFSVMC
jgi:hypothetical protein